MAGGIIHVSIKCIASADQRSNSMATKSGAAPTPPISVNNGVILETLKV